MKRQTVKKSLVFEKMLRVTVRRNRLLLQDDQENSIQAMISKKRPTCQGFEMVEVLVLFARVCCIGSLEFASKTKLSLVVHEVCDPPR